MASQLKPLQMVKSFGFKYYRHWSNKLMNDNKLWKQHSLKLQDQRKSCEIYVNNVTLSSCI